MASCRVCGKDVSCGLVLCGEDCFSKVNAVPDDVLQFEISLILYFEDNKFSLSQTACESEKDVVERIKSQNKKIKKVYFVESQKLINLYE